MPLWQGTSLTLQDGKGRTKHFLGVRFKFELYRKHSNTWQNLKAGFLFFVKEFLLNISVNITINTVCPLNKILYCSYSATVNSFVHLNSFFFLLSYGCKVSETLAHADSILPQAHSVISRRGDSFNCERKLFLQSTVLPHRKLKIVHLLQRQQECFYSGHMDHHGAQPGSAVLALLDARNKVGDRLPPWGTPQAGKTTFYRHMFCAPSRLTKLHWP